MGQIMLAQSSTGRAGRVAPDRAAVDPDDRQQIDRGARQKSFTRGFRLRHRVRRLDKVAAFAAADLEHGKLVSAVLDMDGCPTVRQFPAVDVSETRHRIYPPLTRGPPAASQAP